MKRIVLAMLAAGLTGTAACEQDEYPYLDNRSSAASLVESLYNAINRKEYGRAWSYYADKKPAESFESYVKGFDDTTRVDVKLGEASSEGAAGSFYYTIPVAIETHGGETKVFAGCYVVRLANPDIQAEAFVPMHIFSGKLEAIEKPLAESVPTTCPPQ